MLGVIIIVTGCIVLIGGASVAVWSLIQLHRLQKSGRDIRELISRDREYNKNKGLAIPAATIDHILEGRRDDVSVADLSEKILNITSRWAEYNPEAYETQKEALKNK